MNEALEILLVFIGGLLSYGFRSLLSKWLVTQLLKLAKKLLIKKEKDLALWLHIRNKRMKQLIEKDKAL